MEQPQSSRAPSGSLVMIAVIIAGIFGLYLLFRNGLFSKIGGLLGTVASTADKAIKTMSNVASDFDPFNKDSKAAAVGRAIDPSKAVRKIETAIAPVTSELKPVLKEATKIVALPITAPVKAITTVVKAPAAIKKKLKRLF